MHPVTWQTIAVYPADPDELKVSPSDLTMPTKLCPFDWEYLDGGQQGALRTTGTGAMQTSVYARRETRVIRNVLNESDIL
jgi:hypothetical protein